MTGAEEFARDCLSVWADGADGADDMGRPATLADAVLYVADAVECCGLDVSSDYIDETAAHVMRIIEGERVADFWAAAAQRSDS